MLGAARERYSPAHPSPCGILRIASYNVHRAIGADGRTDPERILAVLREIDADVIALQEVEAHDDGADMLAWLAAETGFRAIAGTTLLRHDGHYGNGILTRCPVHRQAALRPLMARARAARRDRRGPRLRRADRLRVVATHLGLRPAERREQVQQLLHLFKERPHDRSVLMGDLNEWFLWGRPLRRLHRHFDETPALATFPARLPVLALDRIWTHPRSMLRRVTCTRRALARAASDHLPLVATLDL